MTANGLETWPPPLTNTARRQAAERAEQIRLGFQQTAVLYARAVAEQDWQVLGYPSVTAWASGEFGPDRFSAERRKEIVALLTAAGFTTRQIAAATGAGHGTVVHDQLELPAGGQNRPRELASPRQQAAREREARKREAREAAAALPPPFPSLPDPLPDALGMVRQAQQEIARGDVVRGIEAVRALRPADPPRALPPAPPAPLPAPLPLAAHPRQLGDAEIEQIIAGNLTRGQIVKRFGVGEHAAQLARTTAMAIMEERARTVAPAPQQAVITPGTAVEPAREHFPHLGLVLGDIAVPGGDPGDEPLARLLDLYDDLVRLGEWQRRQLAAVQDRLDALDARARAVKLRNVAGRTPEETAVALRLARRLEQRLAGR